GHILLIFMPLALMLMAGFYADKPERVIQVTMVDLNNLPGGGGGSGGGGASHPTTSPEAEVVETAPITPTPEPDVGQMPEIEQYVEPDIVNLTAEINEQQRAAEAEAVRVREEQQRKDAVALERRKIAEAKRQAEQKKLLERKKLEEAKRQAELEQKKIQERQKAEAARQKAEQEQRRRAEAERRRREDGIYQPGEQANQIVDKRIGNGSEAGPGGGQGNGGGSGAGGNGVDYGSLLGSYIYQHWDTPDKRLFNNDKAFVKVRLYIAADGKVRKYDIISWSNIAVVDNSVRSLMHNLTQVPAPPDGAACDMVIVLKVIER
ncbi:MAG: cell envelope integrity protein TolA, partial [Victivallaceae bacterium]